MSDFGINLTSSTPSITSSNEIEPSPTATKLKEGLFTNDGLNNTEDDISFNNTSVNPPFGNGEFDNSDYIQDIDERTWQNVDISLLNDLSLIDNQELFPKEKLMAMAAQYSLGNQELTAEIKQYLEKKFNIKINDPPNEGNAFSSIDSSLLTPNVIKTLSNTQLLMLMEAYTNGTQVLTESQLQYIGTRGINNTQAPSEETDEITDSNLIYETFDPTEITLQEFIEKYDQLSLLDEIAQNFLEGNQPLSTEIKQYIEEKLGKVLDKKYTLQDNTIETNVGHLIGNGTKLSDIQTQELESDIIPDIVPQGNNPFGIESYNFSNDKIKAISSDTLINIQQSVLEEYIELYEQNNSLIEFADEFTESQFMQLYNDYKERYREESEDLPDEVKNKLEANAGGTGTT